MHNYGETIEVQKRGKWVSRIFISYGIDSGVWCVDYESNEKFVLGHTITMNHWSEHRARPAHILVGKLVMVSDESQEQANECVQNTVDSVHCMRVITDYIEGAEFPWIVTSGHHFKFVSAIPEHQMRKLI